ncbi:uncharacterized protein LOC116413753 [Galleria mellonella]|uniref:Uncharacterized protein LOC116413753 n=1 Tax=Galleria mellonella TaxID=7137 RepID=A0A6J3CC74_GALME|nr:uncharacterized protein LOC116413753 [Galleria mellonella]
MNFCNIFIILFQHFVITKYAAGIKIECESPLVFNIQYELPPIEAPHATITLPAPTSGTSPIIHKLSYKGMNGPEYYEHPTTSLLPESETSSNIYKALLQYNEINKRYYNFLKSKSTDSNPITSFQTRHLPSQDVSQNPSVYNMILQYNERIKSYYNYLKSRNNKGADLFVPKMGPSDKIDVNIKNEVSYKGTVPALGKVTIVGKFECQ